MVTRIKLGQLITVKQSQRLLGLITAAYNIIYFSLLYMRRLHCSLRAVYIPGHLNLGAYILLR